MASEYLIEMRVKSSEQDYWKQFIPPETGCDVLMKDLETILKNQTVIPSEDIKLMLCRYSMK